jgi:iron(III) transport system permease protein
MVTVAAEQVGQSDVARMLADPSVVNTLTVGLVSAALTTVLGVGAAILTEKTALPGRRWLRVGIVAPILIPPFVSAMSWQRAYGPSGIVDDLTGWSIPGLMGPVGVIIVISVNAVPLAYLLTVAALRTRTELDLEVASRVSGSGPLATLQHITLPLLSTAILGVTALVFVVGINAFGVPALLGTPAAFDTITTRIYQDFALSARPESFSRAILLATELVALALVFVAVGERLMGTPRPRRRTQAGGVTPIPGRAGAGLAVTVWTVIVVGTVIPLMALILASITKAVGLAPVPPNWTLAHFAEALDSRFIGALGRSALLATVAATTAVLLGAVVSSLRRNRGARWLGVAVLGGFAIPGTALAAAVLLGYGRVLRDTLTIIMVAYVAKLWAVGHRSVDGSLANISSDMTNAARVSGATPLTTLRTVIAPLLRPAILAGWLLVFIIAFHELTMSAILYGPGTSTLAVVVLNIQQLGDQPLSSALAVILTIPLLAISLPFLAGSRLSGRELAGR